MLSVAESPKLSITKSKICLTGISSSVITNRVIFSGSPQAPPDGFDRFGKICLQHFEGFALGKTPRKSRDFSPESALFRLMNNCFQFYGDSLPALLAIRNLNLPPPKSERPMLKLNPWRMLPRLPPFPFVKFRAFRGSNLSIPRDFQDA